MRKEMHMREITAQKWKLKILRMDEFRKQQEDYPRSGHLIVGMNPVRYCKAEMFSRVVTGTIKIPENQVKKSKISTFGFYINESELIIIEGTENDILMDNIRRMQENLENGMSQYQYLQRLLVLMLEDDVLELEYIEDCLESMEEILLTKIPEDFYEKFTQYRRQLFALHGYYEQLINLSDVFEDNVNHMLGEEDIAAWQRFGDRAERLHNHSETLREYLVQLRELYQSRIDVQQNRVMSFLTVVTTIFLPLTLIVGWYGMNFPGMPELKWKYGYPAVIICSIVITVGEIIYFKKKKMF